MDNHEADKPAIASTPSAEDEDGDLRREALVLPSILGENAAVITALLSVLLIAIRLFAVAGYDTETAYGILQASGTGTVLVGVALASIGELTAFLAVVCSLLYCHRFGRDEDPARRNVTIGMLIFLWIIVVLTGAVVFVIAVAVIVLLEFSLHRPSRLRAAGWPKWRVAEFGNIIPILFFLVIPLANRTPWLPAQEIGIVGGKQITGYVLSSSQQFTVVLLAADGKLLDISSNSISTMKVCSLNNGGWAFETLPELRTPQRYPSCAQN